MQPLPIDAVVPEVLAALRHHPNVVIQAPTGAGKTTRVPSALLTAGLTANGRLLLLEPRRLAARAAAQRMGDELGSPLGETVGYHVRFDRRSGPKTRLLVVTPGILLRYLHDDPFLETTSLVIFDEFHERGLESDLALGMVRLLQQTVRPELRLVVMSATLAAAEAAQYLGGCPTIVSEGRLHPVAIEYLPKPNTEPWPVAAAREAERLLDRVAGDLLVFLPGLAEIRQTARRLETTAGTRGLAVLPLFGDLPLEQQNAALRPLDRRKIVLATNVAETSITVEGVTGVVDTGLARQLVYDPRVGLDRLHLGPISKASADQRAGRAGRTQPGVCLRLWSEASHRGRLEQTPPEIRHADLAGAVLHLLTLGEQNLDRFPWMEPPPATTVTRAFDLLGQLGAMGPGGVTPLGRRLARLPVHPRLGRLLLEGERLGCVERAALAAALLAERDPFQRTDVRPAPPLDTPSDLLDRIEAIEEFERNGRLNSPVGELHRSAARQLFRARDQLLRELRVRPARSTADIRDDPSLRQALLAAYPDRVVKRRGAGERRGVLVGGRGVRLAPASGVRAGDLFLALDLEAGEAESLVRLASAIERDWLPRERLNQHVTVDFDESLERVTATRQLRLDDLILEATPIPLPDDTEVARVLSEAAAARLERVVPGPATAAGRFRLRVRCLAGWMPELALPRFDEADLREALDWLCSGCRSFAELRAADWLGGLTGKLTPAQRQAVEREAPERITVPSGSQLALTYEEGRPPVLAVRIQELFGLRQTPRVAAGRIPVLLHLLAPNHRAQQVTDDLASFWANTYPIVRKELRARYPKHAWPDDPLSAPPERRPRRR